MKTPADVKEDADDEKTPPAVLRTTWRGWGPGETGREASAPGQISVQLDLDVDASRQVEFHQRIDGLVGRIDDVHQAQMGADLQLVARGLVDVRRTQHVETLDAGWQRHRTMHDCAGALGRINDFSGGLVDQLVIERFQADTDFLGIISL